MAKAKHVAPVRGTTHLQKQYHTQKRLADALFGLFRTLGTTLSVERVANVGLLTLTGQLLIKCAAFFAREESGAFRKLSSVGAHEFANRELVVPAKRPLLERLFRERTVVDIDPATDPEMHTSFQELHAHGFRSLFPLLDVDEPLGLIALGKKVVPGPLTIEDRQILDAFAVVIALSLKNSIAYEMVETSRNELARVSEMKKEFLDHVSHEFRTPLTVLKNISEMGGVDSEMHDMQSSAVARLQHLVDSVLLLNEINAHGVELERKREEIGGWIVDVVQPMLKRHGEFDLHHDVPACSPELDWFKLGTAFERIIDNAVKFGSSHGVPHVAIYLANRYEMQKSGNDHESDELASGWAEPTAPADPSDPGALLVIEVKDLGIGIPQDELESVFQPFTQAANSPTRGVKGAGLGLSMAKSIVEAHGGEIRCHSVLGRGTIIAMAIPLHAPS